MGEVLEGVYSQIGRELRHFDVPQEVSKDMNEKMIKHLDDLLAAYDAGGDTYNTLMDIRYAATAFQFETTQKYNRLRQASQIRR